MSQDQNQSSQISIFLWTKKCIIIFSK